MKKIQELVDRLEDELCDAKDYAEKYVESKAFGESTYATKYKEMAQDELKHATYIHEIAVDMIKTISAIYTPPADMEEKWAEAHKMYMEKYAWVKQMLTM